MSQEEQKKIEPRDVLYEQLYFYRNEANKLGMKIAEILKNEPKARGDLLFNLYKIMMDNRKLLIDVATKLAPYEHPKLESIEVKSQVEHRYVIRAPNQIKTTGDWLKSVGREDQAPIEATQIVLPKAAPINDFTDAELIEHTLVTKRASRLDIDEEDQARAERELYTSDDDDDFN